MGGFERGCRLFVGIPFLDCAIARTRFTLSLSIKCCLNMLLKVN